MPRPTRSGAHYDWMGYIGNFVAISALIVLPFAGYYLGREIYEFNQQMGTTMMGGFMSWLWVVQAFLIGVLFLAGNYYLWVGMGRIPGAERFQPYTKWMLAVLVLGVMVWATPRNMIASRDELTADGWPVPPVPRGPGRDERQEYRRESHDPHYVPVVPALPEGEYASDGSWARRGTTIQGALFVISAAVVLFYGVYGYFVPAIVRIGFSVYQVLAVLATIIGVITLDVVMMRGAESRGEIRWGEMPDRAQYALLILAVTFTWLMGLMGFARSGIRQHWHVYEVMRDTSVDAATPALGYASLVISACVLIFLGLVAFIFWVGGLAEKPVISGVARHFPPNPATAD